MIIESILAVAGAVLSTYIWETKLRDRISIKRISSPEDPDCEALLDLYQEVFAADDTNYSSDEILELLDGSAEFSEDRHVRADNIILAAKCRGEVVGFLLCHFYPERRKAIISYYAINDEVIEARRSAAMKLLKRLKRILLSERPTCDFLFFDLQGIDPTISKEEAGKRKARPGLFRRSAKRLGLPAHLLQFAYTCPKVAMRDDTQEYPFTLMCVPVRAGLPRMVPRSTILEFLDFIYKDCYGDLYRKSDERFQPHQDHLQQRLNHYEQTLPAEVRAE